MQYTITSQDRPQKSPLYSVNTGLDSFILFNDETLSEQVTLTELMADRECWGSHVLASLAIPKDETTSKPLLGLRI